MSSTERGTALSRETVLELQISDLTQERGEFNRARRRGNFLFGLMGGAAAFGLTYLDTGNIEMSSASGAVGFVLTTIFMRGARSLGLTRQIEEAEHNLKELRKNG